MIRDIEMKKLSGKTYGYARISTSKQSINRQISNIQEKYPDAVIIEELYTGTTMDRPAFNSLISRLNEGDTVVFDEVSRMSRNAEEGIRLYLSAYMSGSILSYRSF